MSDPSALRDECYLSPEGRRVCVKVDDTHAHIPRQTLQHVMTKVLKFEPTESPDMDSWEKFTAQLREPVLLTRHQHTWRMTSAVHEGEPVYQCITCEATAIEGAEK